MNKVIERVALEIVDAIEASRDEGGDWNTHTVARAAIAPLREPTVEVIAAMRQAVFEFHHPGMAMTDVAWVAPPIGLMRAIAHAMIDEAIK